MKLMRKALYSLVVKIPKLYCHNTKNEVLHYQHYGFTISKLCFHNIQIVLLLNQNLLIESGHRVFVTSHIPADMWRV